MTTTLCFCLCVLPLMKLTVPKNFPSQVLGLINDNNARMLHASGLERFLICDKSVCQEVRLTRPEICRGSDGRVNLLSARLSILLQSRRCPRRFRLEICSVPLSFFGLHRFKRIRRSISRGGRDHLRRKIV